MHYTKHLLNTWLLAVVLHPLLFSAGFLVLEGQVEVYVFIGSLVAGLALSLPVLALCVFLLPLVISAARTIQEKIIYWCMAVGGSIVTAILLVALLFGEKELLYTNWIIFLPALFAAILSVLLRFNQFERLSLSAKQIDY